MLLSKNLDIDAVVTYVNMSDKIWQKNFNAVLNSININKNILYNKIKNTVTKERFESRNELEICLASIRCNLPWIRKIWLVVSNIEQVPEYVKKYNVSIVLHKDIIPEKYLPIFNSSAIELFLHNINGLSKHWLYLNDDFIIMQKMLKTDFFNINDELPINRFKKWTITKDKKNEAYTISFKNAYYAALKASNKTSIYKNADQIDTPEHIIKAIQTSTCNELWEKIPTILEDSITPFRSTKSINGYIF